MIRLLSGVKVDHHAWNPSVSEPNPPMSRPSETFQIRNVGASGPPELLLVRIMVPSGEKWPVTIPRPPVSSSAMVERSLVRTRAVGSRSFEMTA